MAVVKIIFGIVLIVASVAFLWTPIITWLVGRLNKSKRMACKASKTTIRAVLVFSGFVLLSIWSLRVSVDILVPPSDGPKLNLIVRIIESLFETLRTFGMEEDYDQFVIAVGDLVNEIIPSRFFIQNIINVLMIVHTTALNLLAPISGGAIVLEIFATIFPKFWLKVSYHRINRCKHFFSELNEASLALAKSIYDDPSHKNPVLIFTDTYVDDENEKEYELLLEAKRYGAICIRDDLVHISKNKIGDRNYYLMDENEFSNLQTLMGLLQDNNVRYLADAQIYLFVQSDAYVQFEKQFNKEIDKKISEKLLKESERPTIVPIRGYRNLVQNLLVDVPLYEPLVNKKDKTKLSVTIFGSGLIGTEAFLNTYCFGQMLVCGEQDGKDTVTDCELTINVVSKDSGEEFWSKIDYINPEIKDTVEVFGEDNINNDRVLCYDKNGNKNDPYCKVRYITADVKLGGFFGDDFDEKDRLVDSDYYIIALGNDEDNVCVADRLRKMIGKKHLEEKDDGASDKVVIAYAVFDPDLANTLNSQKHFKCKNSGETDIFMYAFGSIEQVYSCENIYMTKHKVLAEGTGAAYDKASMHQQLIKDNKKRKTDENKNYNYWADMARALHIQYKAFSLGLIKRSIFDDNTDEHKAYVEQCCNIYKKVVLAQNRDSLDLDAKAVYDDTQVKQHLLAWIEHRRWASFTRIMGYQKTENYKRNFALNGTTNKNMELKLHPCLCEAKKPSVTEACENVYLNETIRSLFVVPDEINNKKNADIKAMSSDDMICMLSEKKEYFQKRMEKASQIDPASLDALDRFSLDWGKFATSASIADIDKMINELEGSKIVSDKIKNDFFSVWAGIYCEDYKIYDYYTYDYDKESDKCTNQNQSTQAKSSCRKNFWSSLKKSPKTSTKTGRSDV